MFNTTACFEEFNNRKYFGSLNGVRCLCALGVIIVHTHLAIPGLRIFELGSLGVDMFFVISGFLIVTLLLRERDENATINLKAFYLRRTLRIFPIYYLYILSVLLIFLMISPWKPNSLNLYKDSFPVFLTYTQNIFVVHMGLFFHCWSLAMEEQFYLLWPTIEKYFRIGTKLFIILLVLLINQACNFGFFNDWIERFYGFEEAHLRPMFVITFTPIILGVIVAYVLHSKKYFEFIKYAVGYRWSPLLFFTLIVTVCEMAPHSIQGTPKLAIHFFMALLLASLVVREDHYASFFLKIRAISYLGAISYGIYLYHVPIIEIVNGVSSKLLKAKLEPSFLFIIVSLTTFVLAHLSYKHLEQPIINLKNKFNLTTTT